MKTSHPQQTGWSSDFGLMKRTIGKLSGAAASKPPPDPLEGYVELPGGRIARLSVKTGHSANLILPGARVVPHTAQKNTPPKFMPSTSHSLGRNELDLVSPSTEKGVSFETMQDATPKLGPSSPISSQDYYSLDQIHSGDVVVACWANKPQRKDEFLLERGDMIRVIGIYDDGWATGVVMDASRQSEEIKAFPLACVCLQDYWRQKMGRGSRI